MTMMGAGAEPCQCLECQASREKRILRQQKREEYIQKRSKEIRNYQDITEHQARVWAAMEYDGKESYSL